MITNHAEFKRLLSTPGVQLETLSLANGVKPGRLSVGQVRRVLESNTTGVYLETPGGSTRGSFLGYDKAGNWLFNGDIATHECGLSYRLIMPSLVSA